MKRRELTKWRERQFLTQANLAALLDVHVNTIANWERGRTRVPGSLDLALEAIEQQRATLIRKLRAAKEERAHQRQMKMIRQHPDHYAKLVENARKAREARDAKRARAS